MESFNDQSQNLQQLQMDFNIKRGPGRPRRDGLMLNKPIVHNPVVGMPYHINQPNRTKSGILSRTKVKAQLQFGRRPSTEQVVGQQSPAITCNPTTSYDLISAGSIDEFKFDSSVRCAFCYLPASSLFGQGELRHYQPTSAFSMSSALSGRPGDDSSNADDEPHWIGDSMDDIGLLEGMALSRIYDDSGGCYAHERCALWADKSLTDGGETVECVPEAAFEAYQQKCQSCQRYGAAVSCKKCCRKYHFPCALSAGAFIDLKQRVMLCPQHIICATEMLSAGSVLCANNSCDHPDESSGMVVCVSCNGHWHGDCQDPPISLTTVVRLGWQCPGCKQCQVCNRNTDDSRMLVCYTCDKGFHIYCVHPTLSSIPKHGWKCKSCRICFDCGSRTPGSGACSRWHNNYTVCDSCYQQRNKGQFCPVCLRAYKYVQQKLMFFCCKCRKYVHKECDTHGIAVHLAVEQEHQQQHQQLPYTCPGCCVVVGERNLNATMQTAMSDDGDSSVMVSQKTEYSCETASDYSTNSPVVFDSNDGNSSESSYPMDMSMVLSSESGFPVKSKPTEPEHSTSWSSEKFKPKKKKRSSQNNLDLLSSYFQFASSNRGGGEREDFNHAFIIASIKNQFVFQQDMCVSCGSFGKEDEGVLISCSQCGQCFHPYCANVRVTVILIRRGWRCLECLMCEGCGRPDDDQKLLLCDDCDLSFHIYCLKPPLDQVPPGSWKCGWCVHCSWCGTQNPGIGGRWMDHYTKCAPCASLNTCPACKNTYTEMELIIQCQTCHRWFHGNCCGIANEELAERASDMGWKCSSCRPHGMPSFPQLLPSAQKMIQDTGREYIADGVILSASGYEYLMDESKSLYSTLTSSSEHSQTTTLTPDNTTPILASKVKQLAGSGSATPSSETNTAPVAQGNSIMDAINFVMSTVAGNDEDKVDDGATDISSDQMDDPKKRRVIRSKMGVGGFSIKQQQNKVLPPKATTSVQLSNEFGDSSAAGVASLERSVSFDSNNRDVTESWSLEYESTDIAVGAADGRSKQAGKRRQRQKRKGILEDAYPSYLLDAFFGDANTGLLTETLQLSNGASSSNMDPMFAATPMSPNSLGPFGSIQVTISEPELEDERRSPGEVSKIIDGSVLLKPQTFVGNETNSGLSELGDCLSKQDSDLGDILGSMAGIWEDQAASESKLQNASLGPHHITADQRDDNFGMEVDWVTSMTKAGTSNSRLGESLQQSGPNTNHAALKERMEKWKVDESLGNGATITAILFANIQYPQLRIDIPNFADRAKAILTLWKEFPDEAKQPFMRQAQENRNRIRIVPEQLIPKQEPIDTSPFSTLTNISTMVSQPRMLSPQMGAPSPLINPGGQPLFFARGPSPMLGTVPPMDNNAQLMNIQSVEHSISVSRSNMSVVPTPMQMQPDYMPTMTRAQNDNTNHMQQTAQNFGMVHAPQATLNQRDFRFEEQLVDQKRTLLESQRSLETYLNNLKKDKKRLLAKQRPLRKVSQELEPNDLATLSRVTQEITREQRHMEDLKRQVKNHDSTAQDYRTKHGIPNDDGLAVTGGSSSVSVPMTPSPGLTPDGSAHFSNSISPGLCMPDPTGRSSAGLCGPGPMMRPPNVCHPMMSGVNPYSCVISPGGPAPPPQFPGGHPQQINSPHFPPGMPQQQPMRIRVPPPGAMVDMGAGRGMMMQQMSPNFRPSMQQMLGRPPFWSPNNDGVYGQTSAFPGPAHGPHDTNLPPPMGFYNVPLDVPPGCVPSLASPEKQLSVDKTQQPIRKRARKKKVDQNTKPDFPQQEVSIFDSQLMGQKQLSQVPMFIKQEQDIQIPSIEPPQQLKRNLEPGPPPKPPTPREVAKEISKWMLDVIVTIEEKTKKEPSCDGDGILHRVCTEVTARSSVPYIKGSYYPSLNAVGIGYLFSRKKTRAPSLNPDGSPRKRQRKAGVKPKPVEENPETIEVFMQHVSQELVKQSALTLQEPIPSPENLVCCPVGIGSLPCTPSKSYVIGTNVGHGKLTFADDFYMTEFQRRRPNLNEPKVTTTLPPLPIIDNSVDQQLGGPSTSAATASVPLKSEIKMEPYFDESMFAKRDADSPLDLVYSSSPEPEDVTVHSGIGTYSALRPYMPMQGRLSPNFRLAAPQPNFRSVPPDPSPSPEGCNVARNNDCSVTLTLTPEAARNVQGVLNALAQLLQCEAPIEFEIESHIVTPPPSPSRPGQSRDVVPLNPTSGSHKYCKQCDMFMQEPMVRKKFSELGLTPQEDGAVNDTELACFCSRKCFYSFAANMNVVLTPQEHMEAPKFLSPESVKRLALNQHHSSCVAASSDSNVEINPKGAYLGTIELTLHINHLQMLLPKVRDVPPPVTTFSSHPQLLQLERNKREKLWQKWQKSVLLNRTKLRPGREDAPRLLRESSITMHPPKDIEDLRQCDLCTQIADDDVESCGRLIQYDVDCWVHVNCALWSQEVYETEDGTLLNVSHAIKRGATTTCVRCDKVGATLRCYKLTCTSNFHLACAVITRCVFYKDKTLHCSEHAPPVPDNALASLAVLRRVVAEKDENDQLSKLFSHTESKLCLRVGSLIFHHQGQLLPHQLRAFHSSEFIYPVGFDVTRFYWSFRSANRRVQYRCSICEVDGAPSFTVECSDPFEQGNLVKQHNKSAILAWTSFLQSSEKIRRDQRQIQLFTNLVQGEQMFGLNEPCILKMIESMPGVDSLLTYNFKYGRIPSMDLPLAVNPSGCARCEPRFKTHIKRPLAHASQHAGIGTGAGSGSSCSESSSNLWMMLSMEYSMSSKQLMTSKWSQYKKMQQECRNTVFLARSKIQGLGLYAKRDIEMHTMIIEYIGELVRNEVTEKREKLYNQQNRGIYMFRIDTDHVIDATMSGGLARYVNHSCDPNCVAEIFTFDRENKIIIASNRPISAGEELCYDYQFDAIENNRIPCLCGAPNCKKWME